MADWVENELWLDGEVERLQIFKDQVDERALPLDKRDPYNGGTFPSVLSFHRLIPMPSEVVARGYDPPGGGYDWQKENWGVKWGAVHAVLHEASLREMGDSLVYAFDTAWEPPLLFFQRVSQLYPELTFYLASSYPNSDWVDEVTLQAGAEIEED